MGFDRIVDMKRVEFISSGKKLSGLLFYPENPKEKNPAILFVHGWTSKKERSIQYAKSLAKLGFISLLFDMRGHGESEGDINTLKIDDFLNDDIEAYDFLIQQKGVDKDSLNIIGSSFGGYLVALLTSKRKTKNLVLRAPADYPDNMYGVLKTQLGGDDDQLMKWRRQMKNFNDTFALRAVHDFNGNVLIIESELDDRVPHETVQSFANAVSDKKKLTHKVMKGAPHSIKEGPFRDEVTKILIDWFSKVK